MYTCIFKLIRMVSWGGNSRSGMDGVDLMFLYRGDRDHGDAFQTHPVSQASARGDYFAMAALGK